MTEDDFKRAYLEDLIHVAPDLDPTEIAGSDHLQDDLELDSMDVLNFVIALSKRFSIEIPEADYPQIATLNLATAYFASKFEYSSTK